jgi:tetratricopeptide (TPR) repeat protein
MKQAIMLFHTRQYRIQVLAMVCLSPMLLLSGTSLASPVSELHRSQAILAINDARLEEAIELLDQAVQADPRDFQGVYLRGSVYLRLNKPKLAQDDLLRVKRAGKGDENLDKQIALSWILIGRNEYRLGQYGKALKAFQKGEAANKELTPISRLWQGRTLRRLGRNTQAIALLSQTLAQYPNATETPKLRSTLQALQDKDGDKPWHLKLQAGLANDSNIGLFPNGQTIPANISNRADTRAQLELDTSWTIQHNDKHKTILDYRLFKANYLATSGYDLFSQTLSVDHRIKHKNGYWGGNYQYVLADMDSFGQQNSNVLSAYHTHPFNSRNTGLAKLSLSTHDYSYIGYEGYSGLSIEGLYRVYVLGTGWNNKFYYGGILRQTDTSDTQFGNTAIGLDAGLDRYWKAYRYGLNASLEMRNYPSRQDNHTELRLYGSRELKHKINLEAGLKSLGNASNDNLYNYTRNMLYLIVGWQR